MEVRLNPEYPQSNVVIFLILLSPPVIIGKGGWGRTSILLRGVRCRSWSQRMMSRLMQHYDVQVDANLRCQRRCQLMMSWRIVPFQDVDVDVNLWCQRWCQLLIWFEIARPLCQHISICRLSDIGLSVFICTQWTCLRRASSLSAVTSRHPSSASAWSTAWLATYCAGASCFFRKRRLT